MALPLEPPDQDDANLALAGFLRASGAVEVTRTLAHVIDEIALPIIRRVLARKVGFDKNRQAEAEDVASEAKEQLLERLLSLRAETSATLADGAGSEPLIRNLAAYVASLAYSAWAKHLSRAYPARAILSNQLRHLLEDRRGLRGFASWQGSTGKRWGGLAVWQRNDDQENPPANERIRRLVSEPMAAAREAFADDIDPKSCALETLLKKLFLWVGAPVEWHDLSTAVFQIREANWQVETGSVYEDAASRAPDPTPTPHDQLRWQEALRWLWRQAGELPLRQRTAYLLHTPTVFEWEAAGIASVSDLAGQVGLTPARGAELWGRLPLDDLTIAALLSCTRQQVINLRRVARDTLGRAWQRWISEEISPSPERNRPAQVISPDFSTRS